MLENQKRFVINFLKKTWKTLVWVNFYTFQSKNSRARSFLKNQALLKFDDTQTLCRNKKKSYEQLLGKASDKRTEVYRGYFIGSSKSNNCLSFQTHIWWLDVLVMSRTRLRVDPYSIVAWMSRNSLLEAGTKSEGEVTATGLEPRTI